MHRVQTGAVDSTAGAGAPGGSGAYGGQQAGGALQPQAPPARHGGQLCRCRQQSRCQESPVAGVVAAEDPELVDCGGAEFADSAAQPSDRTAQGGGGRPVWGRRRGQDPQRGWTDRTLPGVIGQPLNHFCRSESETALRVVITTMAAITISQLDLGKKALVQHALTSAATQVSNTRPNG